MLKGIPKIRRVVVIIFRINQEVVPLGKYVAGANVILRQMDDRGGHKIHHLSLIVRSIPTHLIAHVRARFPIANHSYCLPYLNRTMVCRYYKAHIVLRGPIYQAQQIRPAKPTLRERKVSIRICRQLLDNLHITSRMGQHIYKVIHHHRQIVFRSSSQIRLG